MSRRKQTRDIQKFIRKFFQQIMQLAVAVTKAMLQWLLRAMMVTRQPQRRNARTSGFVLPTVSLLLIVVGLVIGAILFRTGSRTNQVISERNQQVITNAATPAADRAKAKMEYLFTKDSRIVPGAPSENRLLSMMLNQPIEGVAAPPVDPYTLPDETRIDINGDGTLDNAWIYQTNPNNPNSPTNQTIAYSIIFRARDNTNTNPTYDPRQELTDRQKAAQLIVRNGPITSRQGVTPACRARLNRGRPVEGWDSANNAILRKTFQVTAVVSGNQNNNRTLTTLEYQQDREVARGNLWGAWFRYDMHIHPLPQFRWNGAIHTEGSLFLGGANADSVTNYLISSPESCLYEPDNNSEISVGQKVDPATNAITFKGHVVNGTIFQDNFNRPGTKVHIFGQPPIYDSNNNASVLVNDGSDSVERGTPSQVALDPVALFTRGISQSMDPGDRNNENKSVPTWRGDQATVQNGRLKASDEPPPFVDDTYRADDRLGPKPQYETLPKTTLGTPTNLTNGVPIRNAGLTTLQVNQLLNNTPVALDDNRNSIGLDGYWERRAKVDGVRVIVGQRLELGNLYGWDIRDTNNDGDYDDAGERGFDPLYPPTLTPPGGLALPSISHEQQQRRTLRDNLSAVQATAVYYNNEPNLPPDQVFPVACLSTTAHPGTADTIARSKDFQRPSGIDFSGANTGGIYANFFTGQGTNGWEYDPTPINFGNTNWNNAITNLANFAGDYVGQNENGAFPPTQGNRVFPAPYISMWGNFSNLRRAIEDRLTPESIADQTYKQTAACTMGILARSIVDVQEAARATFPSGTTFTSSIFDTWDTALQRPAVLTPLESATSPLAPNATLDNYISYVATSGPISASDPSAPEKLRLVSLWQQIQRDRQYGFIPTPIPTPSTLNNYQYRVKWHTSATPLPSGSEAAYRFGGISYDANLPENTATAKRFLALSCDISNTPTGNNYFGIGDPATPDQEKRFLRLAATLCSSGQPKFPSLAYLFPQAGTPSFTGNRTTNDTNTNNNEPYIQQGNRAVGATFTPLNPVDIALQPKAWANNWKTRPAGVTATGPNLNEIIDGSGGRQSVSFLDSVFFDGREHMPVRVLDMDMNLLKQLPNNVWSRDRAMIFYAFREDAVREDAISRPASGNAFADARNPDNPTDPPVDPNTRISPKPVDFLPDPDRRPYGFRLRNGANISRAADIERGLTFVSDNLVAIQGNFNLHSNNQGASNNMQEFNTLLPDNFNENQFYDRRANDLNQDFASPGSDSWRPVEILADVTAIFSSNFREGSIADGISGNITAPNNNSFASLNAPTPNQAWIREDGLVFNGIGTPPTGRTILPVKISRNGNPIYCVGAVDPTSLTCTGTPTENPAANYIPFSTITKVNNLNVPSETQVNAILVSGVVPARANQGNGGLHNFPRLLENWSGVPLRISGSLMQLNFSTSATGPYEQDAWEPTLTPGAGESNTYYYNPPNRVWGYDVGLQYASAGPLSVRLTQPRGPRSEFYEEPKATDPFVCNLRYAIARRGGQGIETTAQVDQDCRQ